MPGNTVELQVSLGLQTAQAQIDKLREVLNSSVKVDSSSFKDIERLLNKLSSQADGMKGKMGDMFKTSSGAKKFLQQYEDLFNMLGTAREKLTSLGLKDIIFSSEDQTQVTEIINKIKTLQTEIASIEKGKVGKIFDSDSIKDADKIRSFVASLGKDLNELTFSGLSALISKELTSVNDNIEKTEARIVNLKTQMNSLSGGALDDLTSKMEQAIQGATDKDKSTFKTEKILEYRKALEDFYATYNKYSGSRNEKNDTTGSVASWMKKEAEGIADGIKQMKEQFGKYEQALNQLKQINESSVTGKEKKEQMNNLAKNLGLDFNANDFRAYNSASSALSKLIQGLKQDFKSELDIENYGKEMLENLSNVFAHTDLNQIINVSQAKAQLQAIFKEIGVDISDSSITQIFNTLSKNMDLSSFLSTASAQINAYKEKRQQMLNEEETINDKLKKSREELTSMNQIVTNQEGLKDESIKEKQADIEQLTQILQTYINKINEINGTHLKLIDEDSTKDGQNAIEGFIQTLTKLENRQKSLSNVQMAITRWMGFYQVLNLTKRAVNSMKQHITELDSVMTKIAVVTNMSQDNLWGQIGKYSEMARQYGVAIKGVYEVSQLYYQQGLQKGEVMNLTQETLKMARIAGIDYSTAADYMTTAIRGFKLEMTDAAHVTDVFSNLAASTASSTEELAVAISKTAASAASVGSSFEATSAMMATMIATTRESATNIGTALKSIISRYGEMKANITGTDAEGEEYSLNKVDKALQSIGITIHDAQGQFRDFDDVILELAESWDTIDKNTQRYIATVMAGNRQQSRFLALVSNAEEYKRALNIANDAEGTGELQTLKTLDSIDAKIERMKVTIQEFYTSSGIQDLYKGILDTITNVISAANTLPKMFNNLPIQALSIGMQIVTTIKSVLTLIIASIQASIESIKGQSSSWFTGLTENIRTAVSRGYEEGAKEGMSKISGQSAGASLIGRYAGAGLQVAGSALTIAAMNKYGSSRDTSTDQSAGVMMGLGGLSGVAGSALTGAAVGGPWGAALGAITGLITNIGSLVSAVDMYHIDLKREYELSNKKLTEKRQQEAKDKGEVKELESAVEKYQKLSEASYSSAEAMQEFLEYQNQLADSYPGLVSSLDEAGNSIITLTSLETALAEARSKSSQSIIEAIQAEIDNKKNEQKIYQDLFTNTKKVQAPYDINLMQQILSEVREDRDGGVIAQVKEFNKWMNTSHPEKVKQSSYQNNLSAALNSSASARNFIDFYNQWGYFDQFFNDYLNNTNLMNLLSEKTQTLAKNSTNKRIKQEYKNVLKAAHETDENISYKQLTNHQELEKLDEIDNWTDEQLYTAIEFTNSQAELYSQKIVSEIQSLGNLLSQSKANLLIQQKINKYTGIEGERINKYSSFVDTMIHKAAGQKGKNTDWWDTEEAKKFVDTKVDFWNNWLQNNEKDAEWILEQFDISQISSNTNGQKEIISLFNSHNIFDSEIINSYIKEYKEYFNNLSKSYNEAIDNYLNFEGNNLSESDIQDFKDLFDGKNGELTGQLLKQVQSATQQYKKLFKNGQTIDASNYINSILAFYSSIGNLNTDEQKNEVANIIKEIDFTDIENLTNLADNLKEAGYADLVGQLNSAASKLGINVAVQAQKLSEGIKDIVKDIEKVTENIGKGMKFSDALETANKIMEKAGKEAEGLALIETDEQTGLLAYDETLGEYVLTTTAVNTWLTALQNDQKDQIDQLTRSNKQQEALLQTLQAEGLVEQGLDKKKFASEKDYNIAVQNWAKNVVKLDKLTTQLGVDYDLTPEEADRYAAQAQNLVNEFQTAKQNGSKQTWEEFIAEKQLLLENNEKLDMQILQDAGKNSILAQISSFDFKGIATGSAGAHSKTNLQTLLEAADIHVDDFNALYSEILTGNLDDLNELLKTAGGGLSNQAIDDTHSSIVSSYQDVLNYLNDPQNNPLSTAISAQINLIKELHPETLLENGEVDNAKLKNIVLQQLSLFTDWSWMSLASLQQNRIDSLKATQREQGIGKSKAFLETLKDNLTLDEINSLQKDWGISILDENNELIEELKDYYKQNTETGEYELQIPKGMTLSSVIQTIFTALGIELDTNSEFYQALIQSEVDNQIKELDRNDIGKQTASVMSSISSASVGSRINLANVPELEAQIEKILGRQLDGYYEVISEWERDNLILALTASNTEERAALKPLQNAIKQKRNKGNALQGITNQNVTRDQFISYLQNVEGYTRANEISDEIINAMAEKRGYVWDEYAQSYRATAEALNTINKQIEDAEKEGSGVTKETLAEMRQQAGDLEQALNHDKKRDALANLLTNYQDAESYISAFQAYFPEINLKELDIVKTIDGKQVIDIDKLNDVVEGYDDLFKSAIEALADEYINNVSKAGQLITQGTNSKTEIAAFQKAYSDLMDGQEVDFFYDSVLKAWTFDPSLLREYIEKQADKLELTDDVKEQWVKDQIDSLTVDNLDFSNYLSGTLSKKEDTTLRHDLQTFLATHARNLPEEYELWPEEDQQEYLANQVDIILNNMATGGQAAIEEIKAIKGENITQSEIEAAYRAQIAPLQATFDSLNDLQTGSIVAKNQIDILNAAGFQVNADGVVSVVGDLVEAYKLIYQQMADTGEATINELNAAYAQVLTAQEQGDIDAISAMGDAMGMTYEALGEILGKEGIKLQEWINDSANQSMFERIGGGKIRITDFTAFAAQRGWQPGSEEYTSAFKSYNDALIELNKKTKESIYDEVAQIESVKPGEQLNLTELYTKLNEATLTDLQRSLNKYDATLIDGILTLSDDANLLAIAMTLRDAAEIAGSEMTAELEDMVRNVLKAYTDAIINGIKGGLTSTQAEDLRAKASDLGINNLQFVETADGLKLAQTSAIQLYNALKNIDGLQAKLVFDELNSSLQETNEHYKSISDIQNRIAWIESETHPERAEQYAQELALAKEILAVRSTSEDASFSFMSNKIPGAQNNPINYFNDWAKAIHTFNDALKNKERGKYVRGGKTYESGFIDYQDWYNIVTEMNNIAALGGDIKFAGETLDGSLEAASALIQKGAESLVATSTGEIKVALSGMSLDFEQGADAFSGGVTEGIQALANSQVKMLDGMIQLLETVVAMEKLGDITEGDGEINIGDLFPEINWEDGKEHAIKNQEAIDWINNELLSAPEDSDIGKFIEGVKINGESLRTILTNAVDETKGINKENADALTALLDSLWKMKESQQYDLNDIYASMSQIANTSDLNMTVPVGDAHVIIEHGSIILEEKNDKGEITYKDNAGNVYKDKNKALAASIMGSVGVDTTKKEVYHFDEETGIATGTITLDNTEVTIQRAADGTMTFTGDGIETNSLNDYIEEIINNTEGTDEVKLQKKIELQIESGVLQLNPTTYHTLNQDLRKEIENAILSGGPLDDILEKHSFLQKAFSGKTHEEMASMIGLDTALVDNITRGIQQAIPSISEELSKIKADGLETVASSLGTILEKLQALQSLSYDNIVNGLNSFNLGNSSSIFANMDLSGMLSKINIDPITNINNALNSITTDKIDAIKKAQDNISADNITTVQQATNGIIPTKAMMAMGALNGIQPGPAMMAQAALNNISIKSQHMTADAVVTIHIAKGQAKGNIGAFAKGNAALAGGTQTLMGELGPELVVSNGQYFLVGQAGAEFVDLQKDAIVFNHKQTERLLKQGGIGSRGKPFTNEQNAISYAKGSVSGPAKMDSEGSMPSWTYTYQIINKAEGGSSDGHVWTAPAVLLDLGTAAAKGSGPAMASAAAALAALKELRAQWRALAGLTAKDLAGKGGGGGGGGGQEKAFIKDLERWYDWLQHIAQLEKEINYEESLRNKISSQWVKNGHEYYDSQKRTLAALKDQLAVQTSLTKSQESYFEKRRGELNKQSAFSALYGFSETGQLYYKDVYADGKSAFEWLSDLAGRKSETGEANYTAQQQYEKLVAAGFEFAMQFDSSGNEIKKDGNDWYATAVQAFWDKIDADKEEMQSLHDSVEEGYQKLEELQQQQNELIKEMRDNQMDLEQKIYDTIVDIRERAIEELEDTKNAIQDQNDRFIKGLSDALQKEQDMYNTDQSKKELDRLRRQRDILLRSGGSAAEIASLNEEIADKEQDAYFQAQQDQINAIQEASDKQIERLEQQINIENEILDYQKKYGLLWEQVTQIMAQSPEEIANFIQQKNSEYWDKSPVAHAQDFNELIFQSEQWQSYRDDTSTPMAANIKDIRDKLYGEDEQSAQAATPEVTTPEGGNGGGGNGAGGASSDNENKSSVTKHDYKSEGPYTHRHLILDYIDENNYSVIAQTSEPHQFDGSGKCKLCGHQKGKAYTVRVGDKEIGAFNTQAEAEAAAEKWKKERQIEAETQITEHDDVEQVVASLLADQENISNNPKADENIVSNTMNSDTSNHWRELVFENGEKEIIGIGPHQWENNTCTVCGRTRPAKKWDTDVVPPSSNTSLTPAQTQTLKEDILNNKPKSLLVNLLQSYKEAYQGLPSSAYDSISNNTSTQIDKAEINLHIDKLANDYDARQAANTIMDEMLRIASKTPANNSVRR